MGNTSTINLAGDAYAAARRAVLVVDELRDLVDVIAVPLERQQPTGPAPKWS